MCEKKKLADSQQFLWFFLLFGQQADEYEEMKKDTLAQMKEFQATLTKMMQGNMTLVDEFGAVQLVMLVSFLLFY
jgi:hypothetical protein